MEINHNNLKKSLEFKNIFTYFKNWEEKRRKKLELNKRFSDIENFMYPSEVYHFASEIDKNNDKYLMEHLIKRDDLLKTISDPETMKEVLVKKLKDVPHTYRNEALYTEFPENIYKLSNGQLIRVYLLIEALENDEKLRNNIGELLEKDLNDPSTEYGGLVEFDKKGKIVFHPIKSEDNLDSLKNHMYAIPPSAYEIPRIAEFHFHAVEKDNSKHAGPSPGDYYNFVFATRSRSAIQNRHWIIVTLLDGYRFNVDYMGKGPVVIDLGNYSYKTCS